MAYCEIQLPYFKQGDDLNSCLSESKTVEEALESHALMLEASASILRGVKKVVAGHTVDFNADTHHISVEGPEEVINKLIELELGHKSDWDEEDEEDWEDEDYPFDGEEEIG